MPATAQLTLNGRHYVSCSIRVFTCPQVGMVTPDIPCLVTDSYVY